MADNPVFPTRTGRRLSRDAVERRMSTSPTSRRTNVLPCEASESPRMSFDIRVRCPSCRREWTSR